MILNQSNRGRLARAGGSAQVWEKGQGHLRRDQRGAGGGSRETTCEAWSGVCQETKLLRSENTREEQRGEIKKKPYHCHETSVLLRGTSQTCSGQGQDRENSRTKDEGGSGEQRQEGSGTRPTDTLCSFPRAATAKPHKHGGLP